MFGVYLYGLERHGEAYVNDDGEVHLSLPERLPFEERDDTEIHIVQGEETLLDIAAQHYRRTFRNPVDLWQVIAEFQEHTIIDPSVPLDKGMIVLIPSKYYCADIAFGESLSEYPQI